MLLLLLLPYYYSYYYYRIIIIIMWGLRAMEETNETEEDCKWMTPMFIEVCNPFPCSFVFKMVSIFSVTTDKKLVPASKLRVVSYILL